MKLVDEMSAEFPEAKFSLEIKDSYENMKPYLDKAPKVLEIVRAAYRACGMEPQEEPIRGGTDGARASLRARVALPERVHGRHELSRRL